MKDFSPKEVLDDCVKRIEKIDPALNCISYKCIDKAYDQVKNLPSIDDINLKDYPLFGIPVGVKDLNDIQDVKTTQGSHIYENFIPEEDDNIVSCMRSNGAIFLVKQTFLNMVLVQLQQMIYLEPQIIHMILLKAVELQVEELQSR